MKKFKTLLILLILIGVATLLIASENVVRKNQDFDYVNELINSTKGEIIEEGLKAEYITNNKGEVESRHLLNKLNLENNLNLTINNEECYCMEFSDENLSGYIESRLEEGNNIMVFDITKKSSENNMDSLERNIRSIVKGEGDEIKFFKYIKAKLPINNQRNTNDKLVKLLKSKGANNVESIAINNGYSTVANTGNYENEISNGKIIDFNYVLCNYNSGNYLLVGTPEIISVY